MASCEFPCRADMSVTYLFFIKTKDMQPRTIEQEIQNIWLEADANFLLVGLCWRGGFSQEKEEEGQRHF